MSRKLGLIRLFIFVPILLTNFLLFDERLQGRTAIRDDFSCLQPLSQSLSIFSTLRELHDLGQAK
ncbi:hypothetical protein [Pseudomonas vranovensis]|uniref:hypothetical protein n=1 Tax=Pseudomonas vranovensis TaxID=321661 RepID=UPI003D9615B8